MGEVEVQVGSWRSCESEAKCSQSPRWMGSGKVVEEFGGLCLCVVAPSVGLLPSIWWWTQAPTGK